MAMDCNKNPAEVPEETVLMIISQPGEPNDGIRNKNHPYVQKFSKKRVSCCCAIVIVLISIGLVYILMYAFKTYSNEPVGTPTTVRMPRRTPMAPITNLPYIKASESKALGQIMQRMGNSKYDPCDNFYEFACDGVIKGEEDNINVVIVRNIVKFNAKISEWKNERNATPNIFNNFDNYYRQCAYTFSEEMKAQCLWKTMLMFDMPLGLALMEEFDVLEVSETILGSVIEAAKQLVNEGDWLDSTSKDVAIKLIDSTNVDLGVPSDFASWEVFEKMSDFCSRVSNVSCPKIDLSKGLFGELTFNLDDLYETIYKRKPNRGLLNDELSPLAPGALIDILNKILSISVAQLMAANSSNEYAINYGFLGFTLAHEFSHYFDEDGWKIYFTWSYLFSKFDEKAECIERQYKPQSFLSSTTNDDFADFSGLEIAYRALENILGKDGMTKPFADGLKFTNEQIFFISHAQNWCTKKENLGKNIGKLHSPQNLRVLNPLKSSDAFAKAFNCPVGSPMNPVEKCRIWIKP